MNQRSANDEISFLGLKFTLLRTALSIADFVMSDGSSVKGAETRRDLR